MNKQTWALALLISLILTSCSSFQGPPSIRDTLGYGYVTVESLAESAIDLNERGQISDDERAEIRDELTEALRHLDTARDYIGMADSVNGLGSLNAALGIIRIVTVKIERTEGG